VTFIIHGVKSYNYHIKKLIISSTEKLEIQCPNYLGYLFG
jgi:hypothetical protein